MATKKQQTEPKPEEIMEETAAAEPAEKKPAKPAIIDEWAEEVEMIVPRKMKGDDPQYYVCVNDRRFYVPANGKRQKLPKPIAEVLQQSLEAEMEAEEFADSIPNKTGPGSEI